MDATNGGSSEQHSLPHADEARLAATTAAFGMIDHYKQEGKRAGSDLRNRDEEHGAERYGLGGGGSGEDENEEEAPINPTAANKEKRKKRYILSYCKAIVKYSALSIAGASVIVAILFLLRSMKLRKDNKALTAEIDGMNDQITKLQKGILDARGPFKPQQLKCDKDLNTLMGGISYSSGDGSVSAAESRDPNLPGFYGCVSNDAAATLLEAQARVQKWSTADAPLVGSTPDWIKRRVPDYGVWLYPRLKLILFSCPKCGNSESRTMLTVLSTMKQQRMTGTADPKDPKAKANELDWMVPSGAWTQESTDSWRLSGTFKGEGNKGMSGGDKATADAFDLVHQLLTGVGEGNGGQWHSLAIVRHPYERFVEAYAELEAVWGRLPDKSPEQKVLNSRPFSKMPLGSWERCQAFFADYVLGRLSGKDGTSQCVVSSLPELYNVVPTAAGYMRTGTGSGAYYSPDRIISIDQIHDAWPALLSEWGFDRNDDELVQLADVHLSGGRGYGYYITSDAAAAARDLLASDDEFRSSVDAFYAQDFSCFGFKRGQEVLGVEAKANKPTLAPTAAPAGAGDTQEDSSNPVNNPGNG